jgi:hypothetical protein
MKKLLLLSGCLILLSLLSIGQDKATIVAPALNSDEYKPLKLNLNEDGSKYIRFLLWGQFWLQGQNLGTENSELDMRLRRARMMAFSQISPRFLILFHFGLNNLTDATMDPLGNQSDGPQLFLHDAWSEFTVVPKNLYIGFGLHYWNGMSRLTNESTVNFLTMDNYRRSWMQFGLTNQFARHLGVYAKGSFGRLFYRVAANSALINSLDVNRISDNLSNRTLYTGKYEFGNDARWVYQGYFEYMFLDKESDKLPYKVGTYLGEKRVLNIGAGFFSHPNGSVTYNTDSTPLSSKTQNDVFHFSVDVFYDTPLGNGAITAYAVFYQFNYGPEYTLDQIFGTGNSFMAQFGYLVPEFSKKFRIQPYFALNTSSFEAFDNTGSGIRTGFNLLLNGHHAKFTLEYENTQQMYNEINEKPDGINTLTLQAQIFL